MPQICVSIGRTRHKMMVAEHKALADRGAELVEFRLDWLSRMPDIGRLLADRPTPCVVTCRRKTDRGRWRGSDEQRLQLLRTAIVSGAEYVDIEEDLADTIPRYGPTRRIVSYHNFEETPENLEEIYARMCNRDADILKIVTMANSPVDNVRMLQLVDNAAIPTIGFCMGELGIPSRILCGKYGSPFTYATFSKDRELAPGQIPFQDMRDIYHFPDINRDTQVFGVLGDPIGHSYSPLLHNSAFRHEKLNCVYLPFRVPEVQLKETIDAFAWLEIGGYSVTIPHKENVIGLVPMCDDITKEIGAANTMYRGHARLWQATNTDYEAALATIRLGFKGAEHEDGRLQGRRVVLLGAGGVARAIGLGMVRAGAEVTLTSRSPSRAEKLAARLGCKFVKWENRGTVAADILINCTPVGMHPNVDDSPYPVNWFSDDMLVFDTIYNPENTLFLKEARAHDCRTVSGLEMFVRQAAVQFECFTGQSAPIDHMRETLRRGISPVRHQP